MTIEQDLIDLMPYALTVERKTGQDGYGKATYGTPFTVAHCRIEGRMRRVTGQDGRERVSSMQIYLDDVYSLSPLDRITLPAPWSPIQPVIITVERQSDDVGAYYEAIYT